MAGKKALIPAGSIENKILVVRGHNALLDFDLAQLYEVETKVLNQAVTRNIDRFPEDFMFRLTPDEVAVLNRSQTVTGSQKHRDPRYPPRAFTQEGVAMLSSPKTSVAKKRESKKRLETPAPVCFKAFAQKERHTGKGHFE